MKEWLNNALEWGYSLLGGASKEKLAELEHRLAMLNERANLLEAFRDDLVEVCEELVKNIRTRSRGDVPNDCSSDPNLMRRLIELGIAEQIGDRVVVVNKWAERFQQSLSDLQASPPPYKGKK